MCQCRAQLALLRRWPAPSRLARWKQHRDQRDRRRDRLPGKRRRRDTRVDERGITGRSRAWSTGGRFCSPSASPTLFCHNSKIFGIILHNDSNAWKPVGFDFAAAAVAPELDELLDREDAGQILDALHRPYSVCLPSSLVLTFLESQPMWATPITSELKLASRTKSTDHRLSEESQRSLDFGSNPG